MSIEMKYLSSPPNKWTFNPPKVRDWVENNLEGKVLNLFAGKTKLYHNGKIIRNDIDDNIDATYHFDAIELHDHFKDDTFDTVILDPPYTVRKSREKYNGTYQGKLKAIKEQLVDILRPNGIGIHFGYDTTGFGRTRGFKKEKVLVVNHAGDHNDTLSVLDRKEE